MYTVQNGNTPDLVIFFCGNCTVQKSRGRKVRKQIGSPSARTDRRVQSHVSKNHDLKNTVPASVADPDPGSGAFLTPESGTRDG
jgi:hypothetical protein